MMKKLKIRGLLVVFCLFLLVESTAQNLSQHNWYFGGGTRGIRFSRSDNSASLINNKATPFGIGGAAVATDPVNANVLFYTDGVRVYNSAHLQMSNGGGLFASAGTNQPAAIGRIPGSTTQYLIFTNQAGTIFVTTVDMTLPGGEPFPTPPLGNVTTKNVATGLTGKSEGMITIPHANGTDFWLVTHQSGTDQYQSILVGAGGVLTPSAPVAAGLPIAVANFSHHPGAGPGLGKIAASPQTANDNVVILNFDNTSGAISFDQFVFNSAATTAAVVTQAIYDTEWSRSGQYLYISRHGDGGVAPAVFQFDILNPTTSLANVSPAVNRSYGLQLAPDSSIYHIYETGGIFRVGRIANSDTVASAVVYTPDAFGAGINFSGTQFPSFLPASTNNLTVTFVADGTCSPTSLFANSPISFYPTVTPGADSLVWDFGDGTTSSQWSPIHTFDADGSFTVTVTAYLAGETATSNQNLTINPFDLQLTLVQDTTACTCELPVNNGVPPCPNVTSDDFSVRVRAQGAVGTVNYLWSNGDTGDRLTPDDAGYYYVVAVDGSGCSSYAGVNVREYGVTDQRANVWYFGQTSGIDFNNPPGTTAITGPINTREGVSVISDRNGDVVLSTDGVNVYDKNDALIQTGIGGDQESTQAALIIPVQGDETLYYIFTTQQVHGAYTYELRYSLYDLKLNGGNGGLTVFNQLLFTRSTERITGNGNWLIAHEYGNNSFRAYPVSALGIGNPVISSIGSDHVLTDEYNGQGYMELGSLLAVALPSLNTSNFIEFFDFDNNTGEITNFRSVDLNATAQQVYGIEFVGNKIFATLRGTPNSFLREMYIDFQGNPVLIPPGPASGPFAVELGAIQMGSDGQIYVAEMDRAFLGTIQVNGDTTLLSTFTINGFPLVRNSKLGLPNFIQNIGTAVSAPGMQISGFCEGSPTQFVGSGTDPIDEFLWSFGDGFSSDSASVQHTYPTVGVPTNYLVTLQITNRCGLNVTLSQTITIYPPPPPPTFLPPSVPQPVLCTGSLTLEAEPTATPGNTYLWSTGETTRTIIVRRPTTVDVTITSAQGCSTNGQITIVDNRPQVNLGPDQTICQNTVVPVLNAQNPGANFQWFVSAVSNGPAVANGNTAQTQPVNTAVLGNYEYKVQVLDPITTCFVRDSVIFSINQSPVFGAIVTNPVACGANGQIAVTITAPASRFTYSIAGITPPIASTSGTDAPTGPLPVFNGKADTYIIDIEDQISGCSNVQAFAINDISLTVNASPQLPTCNPGFINVTTNVAVFAGATYTVTNTTTGVQVIPPTPFATANFTTTAVPVPATTDYTVQINAQGCVATANVSMVPSPATVVSFDLSNICAGQVTAVPTNAAFTYTWSIVPAVPPGPGGGIIGGNGTPTVTISPGNWNLTVIVNDGVLCPGTATTPVSIDNPVTPDFTQSDGCADQVTLTATPTGTFTYQWQNVTDGTTINSGSQIIVGLADNGDDFTVRLRSTVTGCFYTSPPKEVFVAGNMQLTMNVTTPCQGSAFALNASSNILGTNFQWGVNGANIPGATQPTLTRTTGGLYKLTGTLPGCTRSIEQQVTLFPVTAGSLRAREFICNRPENPQCITDPLSCLLTLHAGTNFDSWQWFQDGVLMVGETDEELTVSVPGTYSVELVNAFGCASSDQSIVLEECKPIVNAPTAFRPGSSIQENKAFYLFTYFIQPESFQLFIYNRWGELVYQSSGLDDVNTTQSKRWNGGYNNDPGKLLPAGTYSYIVKYRSAYSDNASLQEKRGGVVLIR